MRTAPASNQKMSKESSPALQSKPILASEAKETITPVSHTISLTELTASLEVLNAEVDKRLTIVHRAQTSSSSGANKIPGSPDTRDQKTSPPPIHRPRRYALQMWLEVEVGPGLFGPPEDNSYSVDFAMEVINPSFAFCIYICIYVLSLRCTTNFVPTASLDTLFLSMRIERHLLGRQSPFSFCSSHVQLQRFENKVNTNFYSI